ncbi:SpoIIE family protein phosphatase [Streptomyces sp. DH24]|uniref:SpoIIE family protein phosphatase n=1 Tax=Streptomyces sp. DH24 TaxID=3040123 RepID=UPI0024430037|nr:SpoIIE family protein phosphatase [Streptomyces sp. DH24]MDG9718027.1 SpoIIE family protein phosphatase [Streptomyces sp. DH24]
MPRPDGAGSPQRGGPPVRIRGAGGHAARAAGERARADRLRFLDAATRRIARSMELDETLDELTAAAVPGYADRVHVFLRHPQPLADGAPDTPTVLRAHGTARLGDALPTAVTRRLAGLLRGRRPVFGDSPASAATLQDMLGSEAGPRGRRSIVAPLLGRDHALGVVVLTREAHRPAFAEDDLFVASQLATLAALGIDKAVRHGHEASVADALQRTMLPQSLPEPTGVRLASRYLPASRTAQVGGDWYDAIPLPGSRVALVIGDVMGHSVTSAAIMGQLRTIVQTLAGLDLPPAEILHHLDEQAERLGGQHMATCLYVLYDPVQQRLLMANAGHPPPLLVRPDGTAEIMKIPTGVPIGVGGCAFESTEMPAPPGATLMLYTDGLVESRGSDLQTGVEQLATRLDDHTAAHPGGPPPLESLCDEALRTLGHRERHDDVALLAARLEGVEPETVTYWYLAPHPRTAGQARRLARRTLRRWQLDPLLETTELLVSEVIGNAVRFATRPISLRILRTDVLRCEVGDDAPQVPRMRHAQLSDEGGRGLWLVDQLADRWGATRLSTGKVVWFELELPEE